MRTYTACLRPLPLWPAAGMFPDFVCVEGPAAAYPYSPLPCSLPLPPFQPQPLSASPYLPLPACLPLPCLCPASALPLPCLAPASASAYASALPLLLPLPLPLLLCLCLCPSRPVFTSAPASPRSSLPRPFASAASASAPLLRLPPLVSAFASASSPLLPHFTLPLPDSPSPRLPTAPYSPVSALISHSPLL